MRSRRGVRPMNQTRARLRAVPHDQATDRTSSCICPWFASATDELESIFWTTSRQ
jgi:hypothetical protein